MGLVIPLKNSVSSSYWDLRNLVKTKLIKVETIIESKLESKVELDTKNDQTSLELRWKKTESNAYFGFVQTIWV